MPTPALRVYAGRSARAHLAEHGLRPRDVRVIAGAAGGPKGLVLGALDRYLFGHWLPGSRQTIHLAGASIGAWRMATAALADPCAGFERLTRDYIGQSYQLEPGRTLPTAAQVSREFEQELRDFFDGQVDALLAHPRYRLHIVTSRGRHVLGREGAVRTPLGYAGALLSNALSRRTLGAWLERVVFSAPGEVLPVDLSDLRHRQVQLTAENFRPALLASCSIPFALKAVHDIPGAPPGAYWDGGITDYHLHWNYPSINRAATAGEDAAMGLVVYPHFQKAVVPGWLDKALRHRHRTTPFLDNVVVLAPDPAWVRTLPNGKLPDRSDFKHYATDLAGRMAVWRRAVSESERLADELATAVAAGPGLAVEPL
ncbi:phospholipase [Methylibium sp.]|uniref:phospholipase n=1 Tax=Methylibium sp. TaxID=2067992 RepID=UPI003D0D167A